jgi:hypothetical protein
VPYRGGVSRPHEELALSAREAYALRASVAFVWLATGLSVLHPTYRALGGPYLTRLGAPLWLMPVTCVAEVLLALTLLLPPRLSPRLSPRRLALGSLDLDLGLALTALQVGMVSVFTLLLAWLEPKLLAHPLGVLSKNLPFVLTVVALDLHERPRPRLGALAVLRVGMAVVWLTEGVLPKLLFQDAWELGLVTRLGLPGAPSLVVGALGVAQASSGVLALTLRGPSLRVVLGAQLVALAVLPTLVGVMDPHFLVHPFGPLTKNAPLVVGTLLLLRRCSTSR